MLWGEDHTIDDDPDDRIVVGLGLEIRDPIEDLFNIPDIPEARTYLVESLEYRWLLSRILAVARTMPTLSTESDIRADILQVISNDATKVEVELDWHFPSFVEEQYDELADVALQQVLCCSGLADKAFASPCIEYAELLWPRLGKELVEYLSRGLQKGSIDMSGMLSHVLTPQL